jgi:hypothetical protein
MKVIIAGSRSVTDPAIVRKAVRESGFDVTQIISGCCRGPDQMGEDYGHAHDIPVKLFPADWARYGKAAGIIRNGQMAHHADALIALWNGYSPGTRNMIDGMKKMGKPVFTMLSTNQ